MISEYFFKPPSEFSIDTWREIRSWAERTNDLLKLEKESRSESLSDKLRVLCESCVQIQEQLNLLEESKEGYSLEDLSTVSYILQSFDWNSLLDFGYDRTLVYTHWTDLLPYIGNKRLFNKCMAEIRAVMDALDRVRASVRFSFTDRHDRTLKGVELRLGRWSYLNKKKIEHMRRLVNRMFNVERCRQKSRPLPTSVVTPLLRLLRSTWNVYMRPTSKFSGFRYLIEPIVFTVCARLNDVQIFTDVELIGNRIKYQQKIDFLIHRKSKVVCVIDTSHYRNDEGLPRALIGCELASEKFALETVFGIATDFYSWRFIRSDDRSVTEDVDTLFGKYRCVDSKSLRRITGKIHAILTDG